METNKIKNCLVLSGEYRSFEKTCDSILNFAKLNNLDVYCHVWTDDVNQVEKIKEKLDPKGIIHEKIEDYVNHFYDIEKRIKQKNPKGPNNDKLWQRASMNHARKKAFDLIPKDTYENLVYSRIDLMFLEPFMVNWENDIIMTSVEQSYGLVSDIFAVMNFKLASHFFINDVHEKIHSTPFEEDFIEFLRFDFKYPEQDIKIHNETRYCPHLVLIRNFFYNKVNWKLVNFPVTIQR